MKSNNFFEVVKIEDNNNESMQFNTKHLEVALGKYNATKGNVELNMWEYKNDKYRKFVATILSKENDSNKNMADTAMGE